MMMFFNPKQANILKKKCAHCGEEKPFIEFEIDSDRNPFKRKTICNFCIEIIKDPLKDPNLDEKSKQKILATKIARSHFHYIFSHPSNYRKYYDLIGCTKRELINHLESQFKDGMTWDNYGKKGWHVDHIRPCASFDLTDTEQKNECFNYKNLQPLWAKDNHSKGAKYNI